MIPPEKQNMNVMLKKNPESSAQGARETGGTARRVVLHGDRQLRSQAFRLPVAA
jgi:hypothetical protein